MVIFFRRRRPFVRSLRIRRSFMGRNIRLVKRVCNKNTLYQMPTARGKQNYLDRFDSFEKTFHY